MLTEEARRIELELQQTRTQLLDATETLKKKSEDATQKERSLKDTDRALTVRGAGQGGELWRH